jgi:hypothetical protein
MRQVHTRPTSASDSLVWSLSHLDQIQIFRNFLELIKHRQKNISASLKIYKIGHEAPEWLRSELGSFELESPKSFRLRP